MHDINELDKRGLPGLFVATTEFEQAASSQSEALGFDPAIVWVQHPIQNRTERELEAIADQAIDAIVGTLTGSEKAS